VVVADLVWLNGPFGVGKSATARALRRRRPEALVVDLEHIGYLVREMRDWCVEDFQDIPLWSDLVISTLKAIRANWTALIVVPMTITEPVRLARILGAIQEPGARTLHVYLWANAETLAGRIQADVLYPDAPTRDESARQWRLDHAADGVAARDVMPADTWLIDSSASGVDGVADIIAAALWAGTMPELSEASRRRLGPTDDHE
jgi:hypothetical protein